MKSAIFNEAIAIGQDVQQVTEPFWTSYGPWLGVAGIIILGVLFEAWLDGHI